MKPVQPMRAVLPKPADDSAQAVVTVRQQREFGVRIAPAPAKNGLHFLFRSRVQVAHNRKGVPLASFLLHAPGEDFKLSPVPFLRLCLNESAVDADGDTLGWFSNWPWTIQFAD